MQTKQCENYCPKCNSENIDWGRWDITDNESYIEGICKDCGCKFKEYRRYYETEWED